MVYIPRINHNLTTSEQSTGEMVEGKLIYRKVVKHSGSLTAGTTNNIAHGISSFSKIVGLWGTVIRGTSGQTLPLNFHNVGTGSNFHYMAHVDATNIVLTLDTAWTTATHTLQDPWIVVEYLK